MPGCITLPAMLDGAVADARGLRASSGCGPRRLRSHPAQDYARQQFNASVSSPTQTNESGSRSMAESDARSLGWHRKPPEPKEPKGLELIQGEGGETE